MRKSAIRKFKPPTLDKTDCVSVNKTLNVTQNKENNVSQNSRISSILNILNKKNDDTESKVILESDNSTQNTLNNSDKKFYNVLWRKKSTKKHKTWEGDGVLEISGRTAVLKNEGVELGRATNIKTELIVEDYILSLGGKEVQILELLSNYTQKRSASDELQTKVFKKPKTKTTSSNLLNLTTVKVKRKEKLFGSFEPLILPQPPPEHQWTHNLHKKPIVEVSVDSFLAKVLRPHQRIGVSFLYKCVLGFDSSSNFGTILADEMGLGKTLQCITLIWTLLKRGPYGGEPVIKRVLVVTPSSLTGNWQKEFLTWLGRERIRTFVVDSKNKPSDYTKTQNIPILIISYEMFVRSFDELSTITFDLLICDEGHRLKNQAIKSATLLSQLNCQRRIILTGTPIQNDLQEFYSLANFVNPGCLGSYTEYKKYYEEPIVSSQEVEIDEDMKQIGLERAKELNKKTSNFILRRTQSLLDKYLPTKIETVIFCKSSDLQQKLYKNCVDLWMNREISDKEINHLSVINNLKKICNHPILLKNQDINLDEKLDESKEASGKMNILFQLLENLVQTKEKIVVVSSYTQTLDLLASFCENKYNFVRLDGSTPNNQRMKIVDDFNSKFSKDFVFLLSAKAGGVGLNLIGASRLVLFDSDWNPATDLQAMSRIWRDGQNKSVVLYRFLTTGTIEEKIFQRQISKTVLSGSVVDPDNSKSIQLSDEELKDLFNLQFDSDCSTHDLLNCCCLGCGKVPETQTNEVEDRSCQLGLEKVKENNENYKMNQLMQWEHHKQPFNKEILEELGLNDSNQISFVFKNKCIL